MIDHGSPSKDHGLFPHELRRLRPLEAFNAYIVPVALACSPGAERRGGQARGGAIRGKSDHGNQSRLSQRTICRTSCQAELPRLLTATACVSPLDPARKRLPGRELTRGATDVKATWTARQRNRQEFQEQRCTTPDEYITMPMISTSILRDKNGSVGTFTAQRSPISSAVKSPPAFQRIVPAGSLSGPPVTACDQADSTRVIRSPRDPKPRQRVLCSVRGRDQDALPHSHSSCPGGLPQSPTRPESLAW